MLPPGLLERLELVAERTTDVDTADDAALDAVDADLLDQLEPVRDRPATSPRLTAEPGCCAGCGRSTEAGLRRARLDAARCIGGPALRALAARRRRRSRRGTARRRCDEPPAGRPLGPRQVAALAELATTRTTASPGPDARRAGTARRRSRGWSAAVSSEAETRERPRRPLAARPAGRRGGRPPRPTLSTEQARGRGSSDVGAIRARDPRPLLLDGVTGGGKTAIYVEAIAAALETGRPALVLVPEIALALPLVDRLRADLEARVALVHSGLGEGERADEWRRIRAGDVDIVVGTRLAVALALGRLWA